MGKPEIPKPVLKIEGYAIETGEKLIRFLRIAGRLTLGSACSELRHAAELDLANGFRFFVFDMSEVSYIDAAGVGELVAIRDRIGKAGGQIVLLSPNEKLDQLLQITKLRTVFTVASRDAAIGEFFKPSA